MAGHWLARAWGCATLAKVRHAGGDCPAGVVHEWEGTWARSRGDGELDR